jgi:hypothetical protein
MIDFAECPSCGSEFTNEEYTDDVHHMICECGCYFTVPIAPSNNAVHLTPAAAGSRDDNDTEPQAQVTADR